MSKVPLPGSEWPEPAGARRIGVPAADQRLTVSIVLRPLSPQGEAPGGPRDPSTVIQSRFETTPGADPQTIAAVEQFAHEENLTVETASSERRMVRLSGSVAQLEQAFQVELAVFEDRGKQYVSHAGPVYLPAQLVPVVLGVFGLSNPPVRRHGSPGPTPVVNDLSATCTVYNFIGGQDGSGQTAGIIALGGGYLKADLEAFFGGPDNVPTIIDVSANGVTVNSPGSDDDGDAEITQDICILGGIAPSATIVVYWATPDPQGMINAVSYAISDSENNPSVLSNSNGWAEEYLASLDSTTQLPQIPMAMSALHLYFLEAAQHLISVFTASGDDGWTDGLQDGFWHVDYPASDNLVTGCGGTTLTIAGDGSRQAEAVWNDPAFDPPGVSGGGVSDWFPLPGFQQGIGVPANPNPPPPTGPNAIGPTGRGVPDVASHADGFNGIPNSVAEVFGGTSAAAPLWAGLITQINQLKGVPTGYLNDVLYGRLAPQGALYDVTSGSDGSYPAAVGWDPCTGWGSPNGAQIADVIGPPTVSSVQPPQGPVGGGITVTILGAQFLGALAPTVTFDGAIAKVQFVSDNAITVTSPPARAAMDGVVDIVVTTVQGSSGKTDSSKFKYFFPIPNVIQISPPSGPALTQVTISGNGFTGVTEVDFGGVAAQWVPDPNTPNTVLTAQAPAGVSGQVHVQVTTGTTSAQTDADFFTYQ